MKREWQIERENEQTEWGRRQRVRERSIILLENKIKTIKIWFGLHRPLIRKQTKLEWYSNTPTKSKRSNANKNLLFKVQFLYSSYPYDPLAQKIQIKNPVPNILVCSPLSFLSYLVLVALSRFPTVVFHATLKILKTHFCFSSIWFQLLWDV